MTKTISIQPKAFFFDFDGVIVDSEKVHMLAALEASRNHGISFSEDYYFKELLGYDDIGLFEHLWKEESRKLDGTTLKELMARKNAAFMHFISSQVIYFDGIVDFIRSLFNRGIPLCVVSGALKKEILGCLAHGNLESYFKFIISADMVRASKPDPESYERAWQDMLAFVPDLNKSDCWAIEDSPAGIYSATEAGLNVIGITNSVRADQLTRANHVISDVREISIL